MVPVARRALSRLWPLCFIAAISLMVFRHFDGPHKADGYLMGDAMVLCQLGLAGALTTGIEKLLRSPEGAAVRREAAQLVLRALEAMPELPEDGRPRFPRAVPQPASPSSTFAGAESMRRPGA